MMQKLQGFVALSAAALLLAVVPAESWVSTPRLSPKIGLQYVPSTRWQSLSLLATTPPSPSRTVLLASTALPEATEEVSLSLEVLPSTTETLPPSNRRRRPMTSEEITKKVLNALLLIVSFGYAAYTILHIDEGMTRGWTQSEIAMRIPLDNWSNYEESLAEKPVYTKTMINVVIYLLGDWLSQTVFQKKNILDFDASRTLKNGFIGLCFGPLVHEYYQFSDYILPVDGPNSMVHRLEKIFMDQTVYLSVKASIYVAAVALLAGETWQTARDNVQEKIGGIVLTAWKFWPLVHCITYSVIPAQHRILWVNCVDLIWNAILASMSSAPVEEEEVQVAESMPPATEGGDALFVRRQDIIPIVDEDGPPLFANATATAGENVSVF